MFASWLSLAYAFIVTVVVLFGVFGRMIGMAPSWSEELARWFTVGIAFVAGSVAFKQGDHVGVTLMVKSTPKILQRIIILVTNILILIFLSYVMYYSWEAALESRRVLGDIINIPLFYTKLNIPLGAAIMMVHSIYYIFGVLTTDEPTDFMVSQNRA